MNGCLERKVLADGKLQHGKWATSGVTNVVLLQEVDAVKVFVDLGSGRTIRTWDGSVLTDLFQYIKGIINLFSRMVAPCNTVDMAELAPGHLQGAKGVGFNVSMANLHGANVAAVDVTKGAGRVEACPKGRSDPPMTMPQGHEQELMSGCGELTGSSVSLEVAMSEGHAIVDVTPLAPMTSPQGRDQEVKADAVVDCGAASDLASEQKSTQEALGVRMRTVVKAGDLALTPMAHDLRVEDRGGSSTSDQLPEEWKNMIKGGGAGAGGFTRSG
jgi:hypothetical protein